eukprot:m.469885 g.469885  ORF g.469885 m.469885 type:complete len:111 (-) comp29188_c0_seq1:17-349(-)
MTNCKAPFKFATYPTVSAQPREVDNVTCIASTAMLGQGTEDPHSLRLGGCRLVRVIVVFGPLHNTISKFVTATQLSLPWAARSDSIAVTNVALSASVSCAPPRDFFLLSR